MNTVIKDAKCPYCKQEFKTSAFGEGSWARMLWGEYCPSKIEHTCPNCNGISEITLTQTYRYHAKKAKIEKILRIN